MPLEIVTVPCLSDNYAYLVKGPGGALLIDAPEAGPIVEALESRGWGLDAILITHHHHDHVGGVAELRTRYGAQVMGPAAEAARLPPLDRALAEGDRVGDGPDEAEVIAVPGHTLGHVAYRFAGGNAVFTADSLMALGCGRLFEGTPAMMWDSLTKLAALPPETLVFSGHEYTSANARFALTVEPGNDALRARSAEIDRLRDEGRPTVPVPLSVESATNPFLRAGRPELKTALGLGDASDVEVFAEIRARKDRF
ncbi:hydroxyacylglutathione hydrolase [Rhodovulum sulfidophilum]|uniref:Hydroxyacylglutathione hydrolase n=1 Tax=Rhodovulum visakhapatnamense TaxID=364297 RepID=A0ABS1RJY0_9RHOB|nr:hydroxyacylglutathione hydrolase [Rhodovulum visakhapatnamense]MBL3571631.1 hydroxyacylglutathione hydrolase [Rhodovulum visakhapatnamense]MBL3579969.1 hydroxyacylglutathione hydrolase [Rhodovulum visakhapatnamense]OLS44062.1 hydroxyacylglutathione hydrolase [Rhodovulum sulfidophilum]